MQNYINNIIEKKLKSGEVLKHVRGIVESVDENNEYAVINADNSKVTLVNKSNEELATCDEVTIHYWTNIGNGWIALRHGLSNIGAKSIAINNAAVMSVSQADKLTVKSGTIAASGDLTVKYGADNNAIIINGYVAYPFSISGGSLTDRDNDYKDMINNAKIGYKEIILNELSDTGNSAVEEKYSEEFMLKEWDDVNKTWNRHMGCVKDSTKEVVMPEHPQLHTGRASLKLFYKAIYSPLSNDKTDIFPYGYADIIIARSSSSSSYTPDYISATVGFKSNAEYNYALSAATRSNVEKM